MPRDMCSWRRHRAITSNRFQLIERSSSASARQKFYLRQQTAGKRADWNHICMRNASAAFEHAA